MFVNAFIKPSKSEDPRYIGLQESGWAIAQKVFHPTKQWPTKVANACMVKNLTLILDLKKKLESDLYQYKFLKEFMLVPGYMPHFELKSKL